MDRKPVSKGSRGAKPRFPPFPASASPFATTTRSPQGLFGNPIANTPKLPPEAHIGIPVFLKNPNSSAGQTPTTQSTTVFGQTSSFGNSNNPFDFSSSRASSWISQFGSGLADTAATKENGGTGLVKYQPSIGTDTLMKDGQENNVPATYYCITTMKEYEGKSVEELRVEDYKGKKPQAGAVGVTFGSAAPVIFGQQMENRVFKNFPGFGAAVPSTSTSGFGFIPKPFGTPGAGSVFGAAHTDPGASGNPQAKADQLEAIDEDAHLAAFVNNVATEFKQFFNAKIFKENTKMKESIQHLEDENKMLKDKIAKLNKKVENLEQNANLTSIEIQGIPKGYRENSPHLVSLAVLLLRELIGLPIYEHNIAYAKILTNDNEDKINLLVNFITQDMKSQVIQAKERKLQEDEKIFISYEGNEVTIDIVALDQEEDSEASESSSVSPLDAELTAIPTEETDQPVASGNETPSNATETTDSDTLGPRDFDLPSAPAPATNQPSNGF